MKKVFIFLVIVAPVIALLYFSLTRDPRALPSALIGQAAPLFQLQTTDGKPVALRRLAGNPVVLNFWSTWCGPCVAEHRILQRAKLDFSQKGVQFFSVLYEDTIENARRFIEEHGEGLPILLDPGLKTAIDYGVSGVPETFFISKEGIVLSKRSGALTTTSLLENFQLLGVLE